MISIKPLCCSDFFSLSAHRTLLGTSVLCMVALCCQFAEATLPSESGVVHFDLDPVGDGIDLGPGETLSEFFDDTFNFAGGWLVELAIGNPDPNAPVLDIDLLISWPGSAPVESHMTLPGGGYGIVSQTAPESYFGLPETNFGYHFFFNNPTSQSFRVDAAVTEVEFPGDPNDFDFGFFLTDGTPAPEEFGAKLTFGAVSDEYVSVSIFIPEPSSLLFAIWGGCSLMLSRRRPAVA